MPPAEHSADVTAVLVAHDGAAWLPEALDALAASTVRPAQVVCVDTGSTDGSRALLTGDPLDLPATTGYGAAVAAALDRVPPTAWVWLLHDDVAPEPDALEALLAAAADSPSAALLGPKVRDWDDPRVLVEVGVTTDRAGHRQTGLERREYDQGQHDAVRDVLAVGTAGALVRRDVWDEVGGLDPCLPVFRDDVDLGWKVNAAGHRVVVVPTAVVRHARAATTGRRHLGAVSGRPAGIDRRHALYVLLAHAAGLRLLTTLPRLVLACLARTVGFLLTRQVGAARDELAAVLSVLARPARLAAARRARARSRTVPPGQIRPLLGSRTVRARARAEALGDWLAGGGSGSAPLTEPGADDDLDELAPTGPGVLRRALLRPAVGLTLGLLLLALAAERSVLAFRGGLLHGGGLLPVPPGAADLWASYASSWHPTAVGSGADAHPAVAVLAGLSTLLLGKPWLAVDVLQLASVPLAGAGAYAAARLATDNRVLRAWAAVTWALLPVGTGAVAGGRVDVAAAQVALPLLVLGAARLLTGRFRWRRGWALGLGLAVATALAPALWPAAAAVLLPAALATRSWRRVTAAAVAVAVPAVLLAPWLLDAGADGVAAPTVHRPGSLDLLLLSPGSRCWLVAGLGVAALAALLRRRAVLAPWAVALAGLVAAALLGRAGRTVDVALQVAGAGLLAAALLGAHRLRTTLSTRSFGWRQVVAGGLVLAAAALPLGSALDWLRDGADDPLRRGVRPALPAFVRAELETTPGLRALVLRPAAAGVSYDVVPGDGPRLGRTDAAVDGRQRALLDAVVADLLSPRGSDAAEALATRAVRYVGLPAGAPGLAAALDAQPGLTRRAGGDLLLWRVAAPTARLTVVPGPTAALALRGERAPTPELLRTDPPRPFPARRESARVVLGPGRPGRVLVLADAADPGWRASFDGRPLAPREAWGWAQAFDLPPGPGVLTVDRDTTPRRRLLTAQGVALALVLVLAAPGARARRGLEVVDEEETP